MTRKTLSNLLAFAGLVLACIASFGSTAVLGQTLTIKVDGFRSQNGVVHVLLYDSASAFAATSLTDLAQYTTKPIRSDTFSVKLYGVKPGTYALFVHHDENANDVFEMNGQTPVEGWGYSNDVGRHDTPDFAAAAFSFDGERRHQTITMRYAN